MKPKIKYGLPLFLVTFSVVIACSLGAVSAANNIHDIKIDDSNTNIVHPEANIPDSDILNRPVKTDQTWISQAWDGSIINGKIKNDLINSGNSIINQGMFGSIVQNSNLNNALTADPYHTHIGQGVDYSNIKESDLNNAEHNPLNPKSHKVHIIVTSRIVI